MGGPLGPRIRPCVTSSGSRWLGGPPVHEWTTAGRLALARLGVQETAAKISPNYAPFGASVYEWHVAG